MQTIARSAPTGRAWAVALVAFDLQPVSVTLASGAAWPSVATAAPTTARPDSVMVRHVAGQVYLVSVSAGVRVNVAAGIGGDGIVLVDLPSPDAVAAVEARLRELTPYGVRYLINTHWHPDHVAGNGVYGGRVTVIAHERVRQRVGQRQMPEWAPGGVAALWARARPSLTFADSLVLQVNAERVVLLHVGRAHTDGDTVVLFEDSGVAVLGDLFNGRGRLAGDDWYSGDPVGYVDALDRVIRRLPPEARLITGHGEVATVADLTEYRRRYAATLDHVRGALRDGAPAATVLARATPEWSGWGAAGDDLRVFIEHLHARVRARPANRPRSSGGRP